ncbi:MAG: heme-binding protein [Bacteroidota bacterium]
MKTFVFVLTALCFALSGHAQVASTYELNLDGAQQIMDQAVKWAEANKVPAGAIAVTDAGGNLLLLVRMDHTFPKAAEVAHGKARTAALFQFPSQKLEDAVNGGRYTLLSTNEVVLKGGLPIQYKGKVIGAIGVSGTASADQDVQVAQAGLEAAFLKM